MGNRSVVGPAWWHVYTADDPVRGLSSILFWLVIFTVWTLGRTSPICAGQHHLNAPTSNGIYTKRPLIVQSTGLFSSRPFPLASVYSQLISRRNFQILLKLVEKLSFDIFHARIGRSYRVPYGSRPHEETRDWADRDLDTREKRMGLLTCCLVFTPIIIIFFSSSTL
jgi:hypothetical protein